MVYGLWFMVYGLWFMVYGLWFGNAARQDRREKEAKKKEMLDKFFAAHAAARQAETEGNWQQARDCVDGMNTFKSETSFKPEKFDRGEPVFADAAWEEYLDGRGIQVSVMVEMWEDSKRIASGCERNNVLQVISHRFSLQFNPSPP